MVKKDSESDDYYEGVKKFDCSFADFDAYMNDLDIHGDRVTVRADWAEKLGKGHQAQG